MYDEDGQRASHEAELWLRRQGLPFFVRRRHQASLLLPRTLPFLVFLIFWGVARRVVGGSDVTLDDRSPAGGLLAVATLALLLTGCVVAPVAASILTRSLLRQHPRELTTASWLLTVCFVAIDPWVAPRAVEGWPWAAFVADAGLVAAALLLTACGVGSLLGWAARSALRQHKALGELATRALPILMLLVVIAFFGRALWEVTNAMSALRLAGVVLFFIVLGLLFIAPITHREMLGFDEHLSADERTELVGRTPLSCLMPFAAEAGPPLRRSERANFTLVLILAQSFQVVIFSALVFVFLVILGEIAFSSSVLAAWLGSSPTQVEVFGLTLPVDTALLKTAAVLSCVSSLNFLVSAASNAAYKSAFYDPLFADARVALAVRAAYLANPAEIRVNTGS